jgi:hypothetical protein
MRLFSVLLNHCPWKSLSFPFISSSTAKIGTTNAPRGWYLEKLDWKVYILILWIANERMRLYCGILTTLSSDAWESFPWRETLRSENDVEYAIVLVHMKDISTLRVRTSGVKERAGRHFGGVPTRKWMVLFIYVVVDIANQFDSVRGVIGAGAVACGWGKAV